MGQKSATASELPHSPVGAGDAGVQLVHLAREAVEDVVLLVNLRLYSQRDVLQPAQAHGQLICETVGHARA